jgi:hypothetical protein
LQGITALQVVKILEVSKMKELKQKVVAWLEKRFGKELYNDLCFKKTIEEAADYFLENTSADEIEEQGGLDYALESWTEEFISAEALELFYNKNQIEMLQENACAAWQGLPLVYTEEEILEAE